MSKDMHIQAMMPRGFRSWAIASRVDKMTFDKFSSICFVRHAIRSNIN